MTPPGQKDSSSLYLVHGNNLVDVNEARLQLVEQLLSREERETGLAEIAPPANQPLTLDRFLSEILDELGTTSFIRGSKRVVVIYNLQELMSARRGKARPKAGAKKGKPAKKDRMAVLVEWLENELPTTGNIAIFVCEEDDLKGKMLREDAPLVQLAHRKGTVITKREKAIQFEFDDHLLNGNAPAALKVFRDWVKRSAGDSGSRLRIYSTISQMLELLFQARCVQEGKREGKPMGQLMVADFPSLEKIPAWKAKKIHQTAQRFPLPALKEMIEDANRLQRVMYPSGEEDYVPDWEGMAETLVIRLTAMRSGP